MAIEHITATDREAMAFIARFPGADTEAVAQALTAQASNLTNGKAAKHPTTSVVSRRLAKLERMACIQSWRNPAARVTHWGIAEGGMDTLAIFGQAPTQQRGINGKRGLSLMHGRDIAHVAAQLMHREYVDEEIRNIIPEPVPVEHFVTDASMQSAMTTLRNGAAGMIGHSTPTQRRRSAPPLARSWTTPSFGRLTLNCSPLPRPHHSTRSGALTAPTW